MESGLIKVVVSQSGVCAFLRRWEVHCGVLSIGGVEGFVFQVEGKFFLFCPACFVIVIFFAECTFHTLKHHESFVRFVAIFLIEATALQRL